MIYTFALPAILLIVTTDDILNEVIDIDLVKDIILLGNVRFLSQKYFI